MTIRLGKTVLLAAFAFVLIMLGTQAAVRTATAQAPPDCGPMDVVLVIDDTGSMGGAIGNVKTGIASIVSQVILASGGDFQLGLVSFKDTIDVDVDLAVGNDAAVTAAITALVATGGAGGPEASDVSIETVVSNPPDPPYTAFSTGNFRAGAVKIVVMVTDNLPGGFDDAFTAGVDDVNAHNVALTAAGFAPAPSILISAIQVGAFAAVTPIMQDYATTTGGAFLQVPGDGTGTAAGIEGIIADCGGEEPPEEDDRFMTGGGNVNLGGKGKNAERYTWGFAIRCDGSGENFQFNDHKGKNNFHLESITSVTCTDAGGDPSPPDASFDTLTLVGDGRLNGASGTPIVVTLTDAGEPGGGGDTIDIDIGGGLIALSGGIGNGNHQAH